MEGLCSLLVVLSDVCHQLIATFLYTFGTIEIKYPVKCILLSSQKVNV